LHLYLSIVLA